MAEELEIGKLIIGLRVVVGNALETLNAVKSTMKGMAEVTNSTQKNVKDVGTAFQGMAQGSKSMNNSLAQTEKQFDAVNKKAAETKVALSSVGTQTEGIDIYAVKIEEISRKYESQKRIVSELAKELEDLIISYNGEIPKGEEAANAFARKLYPSAYEQYDLEFEKLEKLRISILETAQKREEAANRAALSAQRQAESAEKAAEREEKAMAKVEERQKRADSTLALSSAGMMLNTIANSCDGVASKLSFVATQVVFLKQALNAAAKPAAKLGVGIAGGLGIAISVITMLASEAQRLKEESIKSAAEAAQAYATSDKEIKTLEKNIQVLESYSSTTEEVKKAKQELAQMSPSMIAGYDKEGEAILKTTDALKKELEYRKLLADEKLNFASDSAEINVGQYYENLKKYREMQKMITDGKQWRNEFSEHAPVQAGALGYFGLNSPEIQRDFQVKAQEFSNKSTEVLEDAVASVRARIVTYCEGDTTISDTLSDSFFRMDLKNKNLDQNNIDSYIQSVVEKYDKISAGVDETLRTQIFSEGTDERIKAVYAQKIQKGIEDYAQSVTDQYNQISESVGESLRENMFTQDTEPRNREVYVDKIQKMMSLSDDELKTVTDNLESQMQELMSGNLLDDVDIFKNLEKKAKEGGAAESVTKMYDKYFNKIGNACDRLKIDFVTLTNSAKKTSADLQQAAIKTKAAESTYEDLGKGISDLVSDYKSMNKEISDLGALKAVSAALHQGKSAKDYGAALKYVADMYGVTEKEAAGMVGTIDAEITAKEALIIANALAAQAEANFQIATTQAMCRAGQITVTQSYNIVEALKKVATAYDAVFGGDGKLDIDFSKFKVPTSGGSKKSGGGGGSKQNTALDNELKRLEHKKALDDLTYSEELAWLERIRSKYAKTAEEKQELDEKVYSAKKALLEAEREHAKNMDQLTLQEEIKSLESQMRLYRSGTQARMELEEQVYQAKKDLERQVYDLNVYYGKLNLEEQAKQIEKMISKYKEGTQARIDLEKELYDIQKQIKERDAQSIDKVAEGITEALRNRYEQQRDAEQQRIEDSKKSWQEWSDAQVKAIQDQMDALDDLTKQEDQAEEERKRRRKISAMEQAIKYEFDDYNRQKLEEQLETAKKDLDDYLTKIDRDNQKEALREEQDRIKEQAEKEQELLDDEWEAKSKEYEEFLKEFNLKAEAEKMLMKGNQEEILDIIKSYAPEYDMVGQTLGEKLVDGFSSKVKDVQAWIDSLTEPIREQQRLMAIVATEAADNFMRRQQEREAANRVQVIEHKPQISLVVNVNKEISTPSELRNELERMLENMSDM